MTIALVLRPTARPGGLVPHLKPIQGEWQRGVTVMIDSLSSPHRMGPCASPDLEPRTKGDLADFSPVQVIEAIKCTMLQEKNIGEFAQYSLTQLFDFVLSQELWDGAATGNPNLSDGQNLGDTAELRDAIGILEDWHNQRSSGLLGVLHVPVTLASSLRSYVQRGDDGLLRTTAGNQVAVHGTGTRVSITGELWGATEAAEGQGVYDHLINQAEGWANGIGIVIFDPALNAYVDVIGEVSSPTSGSPTSV